MKSDIFLNAENAQMEVIETPLGQVQLVIQSVSRGETFNLVLQLSPQHAQALKDAASILNYQELLNAY